VFEAERSLILGQSVDTVTG